MITKEELLAKIEKLDVKTLIPKWGWEKKTKLDESWIKDMLKTSIPNLFDSLGAEKATEHLLETYFEGFEQHRYYSGIIWKLCAILLPLSVTLAAYTWQNSHDSFTLLIGFGFAFFLYATFYGIYTRLNWQIRKNRLYLLIIENLYGMSWYTFRRGSPIKRPPIHGIKAVWDIIFWVYLAILLLAYFFKRL